MKHYHKYMKSLNGRKDNPQQFCDRWKFYFPDVFQKLMDIQQGNCAVCGKSLKDHKVHVDHDHKTGLVRGLLCWRCNNFRVAQNRSGDIRQVYEYLLNPPVKELE